MFESATNGADQLRSDLLEVSLPAGRGDLVRAARLVRQQTAQAQRALADASEEMLANGLGGRPVYDRMQREIVRPMDRLLVLEMADQREALDALAADDAAGWDAALERQDAIVAEMRALLEAMTQWDRFRDLITQLDETIRLQREAMEEAEAAGAAERGSVFDD